MRTATGGPRPSIGRSLPARMLSLFMALILLLGVLPLPAAAASKPPRTDIAETIRVDSNSYQRLGNGRYHSPLMNAECTIHYIRANVNGDYRTVFCGQHGLDLGRGEWKVVKFNDGSNYAKADSGDAAPYMIFTDYYYSKGEDMLRSSWVQACVWLMRQEYSTYSFLLTATVDDIQNGLHDDLIGKIADEAIAANKFLNSSYDHDREWMMAELKNAVIIPWLEKEIPHLDYVVYERGNGFQPLILGIPTETTDEEPHVFIKVKKVDSKGNPLAGASFEVYDVSGAGPIATLTTGSDGTACQEIELGLMETTRDVTVQETVAPSGCELDSSVYAVHLDANQNGTPGTAAIVNGKAIVNYTSAALGPGGGGSGGGGGDGSFFKVDQYGKGVAGAVFLIEGQAHSEDGMSGQRVSEERISMANGEIPIQWANPDMPNYIPPGHYTIREVEPPAGYRATDEVRHIDLYENGDCSGDAVFTNEKFRTIKLIKQDPSGKGLSGAVFKVERNGQDLGSVTTGPDGSVVLEGENGTGVLPGLTTAITDH